MVAFPLFLFLTFLDYRARAQDSSEIAQCTVSSQNWTTNHEGQSPFANSLLNGCGATGGVLPLNVGSSSPYAPPPANLANTWGTIGPWIGGNQAWTVNCPANTISVSKYPDAVPNNIAIPVWAFQNVTATTGMMFDPFSAEQLSKEFLPDTTLGVDPITSTSTGTSATPSSTSSHTKSPTTTPTPPSPPPPASKKKSNGGTIAGAVVGSIVGVICLSLVAWFYVRYRNERKPRRHYEGSYEKSDTVSTLTTQVPPLQPPGLTAVQYPMLKLYDPEDPSTFPKTPEPLSSVPPLTPISSSFTHSRNNSDEPLTRPGHSRQSSTDTTTTQQSLVSSSTVTAGNTKNFTSGYTPSGIMYRTIPEHAEGN
ncbi:hypothetical protein Clacol_010140 [Clathrus columnatus]|uniref:Uncharacterized protein n=1 Tax=Clathrus columnatus TaxID=1419009 RepID=A0AAV5APY6_9AGAM|nr:hypothetical protein Clacol_010140 [Clathrus columnatus]